MSMAQSTKVALTAGEDTTMRIESKGEAISGTDLCGRICDCEARHGDVGSFALIRNKMIIDDTQLAFV